MRRRWKKRVHHLITLFVQQEVNNQTAFLKHVDSRLKGGKGLNAGLCVLSVSHPAGESDREGRERRGGGGKLSGGKACWEAVQQRAVSQTKNPCFFFPTIPLVVSAVPHKDAP